MEDFVLLKSANLAKITLSEVELKTFFPQIENLLLWEKTLSKLVKKQKKSLTANKWQEKLFTFSFEEESKCDEITSHVKTEHGYFIVPKVLEG